MRTLKLIGLVIAAVVVAVLFCGLLGGAIYACHQACQHGPEKEGFTTVDAQLDTEHPLATAFRIDPDPLEAHPAKKPSPQKVQARGSRGNSVRGETDAFRSN